MPERVIYDFGMNDGEDLSYYLRKADRVVGVEANPALCDDVRSRYQSAIEKGRLVVLNVALSERSQLETTTFYIHIRNHHKSKISKPSQDEIGEFEKIEVHVMRPSDVIEAYGIPFYVKIDLEGYDHVVLRQLFDAGILPPYISAELHRIEVFAVLVAAGYPAFNIVEGPAVGRDWSSLVIRTESGCEEFEFKPGMSGPFGDDIKTAWLDSRGAFEELRLLGTGWRDIHASLAQTPTKLAQNPFRRSAWPLGMCAARNAVVRAIARKYSPLAPFEE